MLVMLAGRLLVRSHRSRRHEDVLDLVLAPGHCNSKFLFISMSPVTQKETKDTKNDAWTETILHAFGAVGCRKFKGEFDGKSTISGPGLVPRHGVREVGILSWVTFNIKLFHKFTHRQSSIPLFWSSCKTVCRRSSTCCSAWSSKGRRVLLHHLPSRKCMGQ